MIDDRLCSALPARNRIDLGHAHEIPEWMTAFGVGEDELREAVDAVGTAPDKVRDFLGAQ